MMAINWYDLEPILPDVWRVNDGDLDTSYIIKGAQYTGVIDTGMGIGDLAGLVRQVGDAPPLVIDTHAHPDHWQGNYQFEQTSMSADEWAWVQSWPEPGPHTETVLEDMASTRPYPLTFDPAAYPPTQPEPTRLLEDGEVVDLGGLQLEVVLIPAHTPGGVALLERRRRILFVGDTVQRARIWLQLDESQDMTTIGETYSKLATLADDVDWILPGHQKVMLPGAFLAELNRGMQRILRGEVGSRWQDTFAGGGWYYDLGDYGPILKEKV